MSVQQFNVVPASKLPTSMFNLSHDVTLSCNMGQLVPILCQEVLPHDTWQVSSEVFIRFAPMFAPILHRIDCYVHYFFVPYQDIWDEWEDFITGGRFGDEEPVYPHFNRSLSLSSNKGVFGVGSLADYLGFPSLQLEEMDDSTNSFAVKMSALPFRAYQFIYNEYYRDQNLTEEAVFEKTSGAITGSQWREFDSITQLRRRAWEKDYFTSALPWTQRGEAVTMPVIGNDTIILKKLDTGTAPIWYDSLTGETPNPSFPASFLSTGQLTGDTNAGTNVSPLTMNPNGSLGFDIEVGTIEQFRLAVALQRYLESNARMGARYTEQLRGRWHVTPPDSSMHRPVYLGGGRAPVVISETFQQTGTEDAALGAVAGNAVSLGSTNKFRHFFNEHGLVMGILSVRPKSKYMQGMPRWMMRQTKFDFYTPELANLGEQPIMHNEIYWKPDNTYGLDPASGESPFGYIPRWSEYRYIPSTVHGDMLTSLDFWHLARKLSPNADTGHVELNTSFVEVGDNTRIFADTGRLVDGVQESYNHHLWIEVFHHIRAKRPLPKFSVPGVI